MARRAPVSADAAAQEVSSEVASPLLADQSPASLVTEAVDRVEVLQSRRRRVRADPSASDIADSGERTQSNRLLRGNGRARHSSVPGGQGRSHGGVGPSRGHAANRAESAGHTHRGERGHEQTERSRDRKSGACSGGEVTGIANGSFRADFSNSSLLDSLQRRQEAEDVDSKWQAYLRSEEFLTFHAVVESLLTLPDAEQLAERRADFELLLHLLHRLGQMLAVEHVSKSYRAHYSPDVQLSGYLYSTLLTAFTLLPSYVLNGQEFYVSDTVLDQCQSLQYVFQETCKELKQQFENLQAFSLEHIRHDVTRSLVYFDRSWCRFELPALEEIEAIHRQACRPLIEAIEVEKALTEWERRASDLVGGRGSRSHCVRDDMHKAKLMDKISELNRLANIDGKGRADMDLAPLVEAQKIAQRPICPHCSGCNGGDSSAVSPPEPQLPPISKGGTAMSQRLMPSRSALSDHDGSTTNASSGLISEGSHKCGGCAPPVLLRVAKTLLRAFDRVRRILQRYARCLYQLNSHLANNPDLVRGLEKFESAWETAHRYLVQPAPRRLALLAFNIVTSIKSDDFEAALTSFDPGFLMATLPRTFILHEMRRFCQARDAALGVNPVETIPVRHGKRATKNHEPEPTRLPQLVRPHADQQVNGSFIMLPRPVQLAHSNEPRRRIPTSGFQFSPMARALLMPEVAVDYDVAAAAIGRLSQANMRKVTNLLLASSSASTPVGSSAGRTQTSSPPSIGASAANSELRERPPVTPCPPRMVVPNSSSGRPATNTLAQITQPSDATVGASKPAPDSSHAASAMPLEDSDEEEADVFTLELSTNIRLSNMPAPFDGGVSVLERLGTGLSVASSCNLKPPGTGTACASSTRCFGANVSILNTGGCGESDSQDSDMSKVVSIVSTLALLIQRTKPDQWNELIQVVLQGVMLARSVSKTPPPPPFVTESQAPPPAPANAGERRGRAACRRVAHPVAIAEVS